MSDTNSSLSADQIREERRPTYRKIIKYMWFALTAGVISVMLIFFGLTFTDLPDTKELENPKSDWASEVYASNGEVLGRYFTENRVPVDFDELNKNIEQALIATEDERYYNHSGIDFYALGRSSVKTILLGDKNAGGASTISQQLAKLLFTGRRADSFLKIVIQKLQEWIIAVRLERKYTKEEIMTMYLNKFDFLYDSHGIRAAAETYFGKEQDSLKVEEAAMLVGMLKNPALFNPRRFPDTVMHRREVVLKQMVKNDLISQNDYDSLRVLPLDISNFKRKTHNTGIAQYFRMHLREHLKKILTSDEAAKKPDGSNYDIYRDGLKIYTTIDPVLQKHAEEAAKAKMAKLQNKFWKYWSSRSKDPWTFQNIDVTEGEMKARERKREWLIRNTDRYHALRAKYLPASVLDPLLKKVDGLRLLDADIDRMLLEEEKKGTITRLISRNIISKSRASKYRKALKTDEWEDLKQQWNKLQKAVESTFEEPVKMRVFAFNDRMEADTVMSPWDSLKYHHSFLQIGSISVDPKSGQIKTWLGGIDNRYFAYDHATANRQVGSTFKPFVYATAIAQQGISPCYPFQDLPQTIMPGDGEFYLQKEWTPANSKGEYTGEILTLKDALKQSMNTASVFLMKQLASTTPVRDLVKKMGINADKKYPNGQLRVPEVPSIALGSCDLTVLEMIGAYSTFANNGTYIEPIFLTRIEDKNGRLIYAPNQIERPALAEKPNFVMLEMLKYTSGRLDLKSEVGGKTGTTNDFVDGWFMGVTPTLVTGTWVGGEDRWIRFLDLGNGQGGRLARPYFKEFMKRIEEDKNSGYDPKARFYRPRGEIGIELNCEEYDNLKSKGEDIDEGDEFYQDAFGDEDPFGEIPIDTTKKKQIAEGDDGN